MSCSSRAPRAFATFVRRSGTSSAYPAIRSVSGSLLTAQAAVLTLEETSREAQRGRDIMRD